MLKGVHNTMIRRLLPSIFATRNSKQRFSIITQLLVLMTAVWLIGCIDDLIIDEIPVDTDSDMENVIGEIVMHQTGGIAGVSQTISIRAENGSILLVYVDERANLREETQVSPEDLGQLWQTLEANDVFTLPTNHEMLETVQDGFFFEITVQLGEKYNQFSVYTPDLLIENDETRYDAVVKAIEGFADSQFQASDEFIIADMPINDISVEILESFPLQIHVVVNGFLRDSCTTLNETTQQREGNTTRVHITTKRPKDAMCAQVITDITTRVPLEGGFLPGHYRVIVNGVEKEFDI